MIDPEEIRPLALKAALLAARHIHVQPADPAADLRRWETKALKALRSGRKPAVAFKSAAIPEHLFDTISALLGLARTPSEVRAAFKASQSAKSDPQAEYDALAASFATQVASLAALLAAGTITAAVFRQRMGALIESVYARAYGLGAAVQGGDASLAPRDKATITNYVHDEDEFLRRFVRDVSLGHVPDTEAYLQNRAGMYAEAIHGLYWEGRASRVPENYVVYYEAEDDANTCEPCALNEANGPYPIGSAPIPGNDCLGWSRCRCKLRFVPASQQILPNIAAGADADLTKQAAANTLPDALEHLKDRPAIFLIRHGDTDLNEQERIRAWNDPPLNAAGREQARKVAAAMESVKELKGHNVRRLVTSDLKRATQTAGYIGKALGVKPEPMQELRSWKLGDFTGKKVSDVLTEMNRLQTEARDERPPGDAETFNEFLERYLPCLKELMDDALEYPQDFTVAVCHTRSQRVAIGWIQEGMKGLEVNNKPLLTRQEIAPGGFLALALIHTGKKWEIVEKFKPRNAQDEE